MRHFRERSVVGIMTTVIARAIRVRRPHLGHLAQALTLIGVVFILTALECCDWSQYTTANIWITGSQPGCLRHPFFGNCKLHLRSRINQINWIVFSVASFVENCLDCLYQKLISKYFDVKPVDYFCKSTFNTMQYNAMSSFLLWSSALNYSHPMYLSSSPGRCRGKPST